MARVKQGKIIEVENRKQFNEKQLEKYGHYRM